MVDRRVLILDSGEIKELSDSDNILTSQMDTIVSTSGVSDAGKIPILNASGVLDSSLYSSSSGSQEVFIQDSAPTPAGQALWIQTGLGDGSKFTIWAIS